MRAPLSPRLHGAAAIALVCLLACTKKTEAPEPSSPSDDGRGESEAAPSASADATGAPASSGPTGSAAPDAGAPMDERALRAKRTECNALVRAANHEQKFLAGAIKHLASSDEGNLEALADALDDSGGRISSVGLHDPELRRIQRDYKEMFGRAAADSRRVAEALRAKDDKALASAKAGLGQIGRDEARIAHELGAYCRPG